MTKILDTAKRPYDVSIIVPFLNELENISILINDISTTMDKTGKSYEVILVDDGSTDGSSRLIEELSSKNDRIKLIQFTRNFGQTAAMSAGFTAAQGRVYVALDADNQNDPADIPHLLKLIDEGNDVVSGWRKNRQDKFFSRKLPSKVANRLLARVTGLKLHDFGCSLKAYRAEYIDSIDLYGEMHRFIPAFASMMGAKVVEVPVSHRARTMGRSKYGIKRTFKVLIDLMTVKFMSSFLSKPGYLFGGAGAVLCSLGIFSAVEVIVEKFISGTYAHKNPFLMLAVFLFSLGVQMILMGLIAEILVRTYHESSGKKPYLIKKTVNIAEAQAPLKG